MRLDWQTSGTVVYRDSAIAAVRGAWPGLTFEEADALGGAVVKGFLSKRKVIGINVTARSVSPGMNVTIVRIQEK